MSLLRRNMIGSYEEEARKKRELELEQSRRATKRIAQMSLTGIIALLLLIAGCNSAYTIDSGHRGILLTFGEVSGIQQPGLNFKIPFIQSLREVDIRVRKVESPADAASRDMQSVTTSVALNYSLSPEKLRELFSEIGLDVEQRIIATRIQETVKAVVARYTAEELITQRENVRGEMVTSLTKQLLEYHIIVAPGGIQITNFDFSQAFNKAIEDKQVAEQQAQKAENDLRRIEVEARQRITQAQGEADAIRIQAEAIRSQGGKEYIQMQAINRWDGKMPTYIGGNAPLPFIDVR